MTNEIIAKVKAIIAAEDANLNDLKSVAKECGLETPKTMTKAQAIEALEAFLAENRFTDKFHDKNHGTSYYLDGKKVFNIKTRRNGMGIVFFTKASGITGHDESRIPVYVCEMSGKYDEILAQAKEEILAQQA